jgi:PAS domain S-box-containing protein
MPSTRPLRLWLASRIALVGMVPLAVVTALVLVVLLPRLRADFEIRHQVLARAIADQIEAHLLGAERELRAIAADIQNRGYQPASSRFGPLDAHAGAGNVFAAIYIADSDGSLYAVGLPQTERGHRDDLLTLDLSKWAVLREARERNEVMWSESFLSAVSGRLAVALVIPVAKQMLVGEMDLDQLSEFVGREPAESGMSTMIFDRQGQLIAHSEVTPNGQQLRLSHLPIVRDALQGHLATHSFELDGKTLIGTPIRVPRLGWIALVAQSRSEAFRPFPSILWVLAAGALVALLLAMIAARRLARSFAWRIGRYAAQAHAIADGDYGQPWPISQIRELDSLGSDLERMALAIRQRERDLATGEARYRSVIGNAPVIIFQFDERGVFTLSEGKGLARIGLAAGEAVGQSLFELCRGYPEVCEYARRAIDGEALQFAVRTRDSFLDVSFNPVRDSDGPIQVMGVAVDITARKRAEESLHRSNRRLRMLGDCNQALVRITDEIELLTTICAITVQEGGYRMAWVGYAEHEGPKTVRPVAHAGLEDDSLQSTSITWADDEWGRAPIGTAIRTGNPCLVQNIASDSRFAPWCAEAAKRGYAAVCALPLMAGDRIFGALSIYSSVPDAFDTDEAALLGELAGNLAFGVAALRTRIERERTEKALQLAQLSILRSADAVFWITPDGRFINVNDQACHSLGYTRDELLTKAVWDIDPNFSPEKWPLHWERTQQLKKRRFEGQHQCKDGTTFPVEITANHVEYEGQEYDFAFVRDSTERKRAETALQESEARLRAAIESVPFDFFLIGTNGRYVLQNSASKKNWGDVVGKCPAEVTDDAAMLAHWNSNNRRAFTGEIIEEEVRLIVGDEARYIHSIIGPIKDHDKIIGIVGLNMDITERQRAEEELQRHREHLEELVAERTAELRQAMHQLVQAEKLAALGHLVAGVAHELSTPLGNARVVAGSLGEHLRAFAAAVEGGTLRRSQVDAFLERSREAVDLLERNAARAADLIVQFKQVAVDQTSVRRRRFGLRQTIEELLATLQPQLKRTAHHVELDIPPDLELDSYPGPLEQVIANLVANSLIHGFAGIATGVIRIHATPLDPDQIQIGYTDNGIGISENMLKRIFDPFFTTKLGSGGSGLGLYIVYNIVTQILGGTIQAHSRLGCGLTFSLVLPRAAPGQPALEPPA